MTYYDPQQSPQQGPQQGPHPDPYQDQQHPQYPHYPQYPAGYGYQPMPPPVPRPRRGRRALLGVGAAAVAVALVGGGVAIGRVSQDSATVAQSPQLGSNNGNTGNTGNTGSSGNSQGGFGSGQGLTPGSLFPQGGSGQGSTGQGGTGQGSGSTGTAASTTQQRGIVTIVSTEKYQNAQSAGTGMILTSSGEILTNNHVVNGATSVRVTDESTGKSYTADVVGTAPSQDVAVLQLRNASGLTTAAVGSASDVSGLGIGDAVSGVGNAGGTGSLTVVTGKVTALEQSITASDEGGGNAEKLTGLIETDAPIVAGDSGGPLYDKDGDIIGIDTAASSSNGQQSGSAQGYAIPIDDALKVADQIESGVETSSVHIGLPGFIGVGVADTNSSGAAITSVLNGGPADDAGITAGSVITAVDGKQIADGAALQTMLHTLKPGKKVSITWTDTSGASHTAKVTLATGPAD